MRLYFAAPLFSQAERHFNERLTHRLEAQGLTVYLPQRDGAEKDAPTYKAMTPEERGRAIFHLDKEQIFACDIFLMLLDGRIPDEGVCVELGLAYCQRELQSKKKVLIGLQANSRAAFSGSCLNPNEAYGHGPDNGDGSHVVPGDLGRDDDRDDVSRDSLDEPGFRTSPA